MPLAKYDHDKVRELLGTNPCIHGIYMTNSMVKAFARASSLQVVYYPKKEDTLYTPSQAALVAFMVPKRNVLGMNPDYPEFKRFLNKALGEEEKEDDDLWHYVEP